MPKEQFDRPMAAYTANMDSLVKEGRLLIAGAFQGGRGIFVFTTNSELHSPLAEQRSDGWWDVGCENFIG